MRRMSEALEEEDTFSSLSMCVASELWDKMLLRRVFAAWKGSRRGGGGGSAMATVTRAVVSAAASSAVSQEGEKERLLVGELEMQRAVVRGLKQQRIVLVSFLLLVVLAATLAISIIHSWHVVDDDDSSLFEERSYIILIWIFSLALLAALSMKLFMVGRSRLEKSSSRVNRGSDQVKRRRRKSAKEEALGPAAVAAMAVIASRNGEKLALDRSSLVQAKLDLAADNRIKRIGAVNDGSNQAANSEVIEDELAV